MQCNQLIRLVKDWYLHVQEETMAPARMLQFTDKHIKDCEVCLQDPDLMEEIEKIRELILPESKIPKLKREKDANATPEISPDADENGDEKDEKDPGKQDDQSADDKD